MSLGEIIKGRREELDLTQEQVAGYVGISKPYLSNIETGKAKNPPTDGVLVAMERALRFGQGELMRVAHMARTPRDVRDEHEQLSAEVAKLRGMVKELMGRKAAAPGGGEAGGEAASTGVSALGDTTPGGNVRGISAGATVPIINKVAAGYPSHFTDLDYPPSVADEYIRCPDMHDPQAFAARVVGDSMEPAYHENDIIIFSPNTDARPGDDCFVRFDADGGTTFKRAYMDDEETIRLQPLNSSYPAATYPRERVTGLWPAVFKVQKLR